jgi:lipopolysaccharide transport system ATP-binding protein
MNSQSQSIEVSGVSKRYRLGQRVTEQTFREQIMRVLKLSLRRREEETIWALKDVSFNVNKGEVVGIIGRNGAGKSTLLKTLSRITYPTSGTIKVEGRVASLLEVGVGFHNELTGRENIFLNGSILGMRRREVEARFTEIVEFAGIEQFIDTQVKHYSSGMRLRLGFAVAAHLDPDVLIVDEVLAVGDAGFQKKCLNAMEGLQGGGRTVLFVSHNMAAVENLCSRGIWIDGGKVRMDGPAKDVVASYMASFAGAQGGSTDLSTSLERFGNGDIRYTHIEFFALDGTPCSVTRSGDGLTIRFYYHSDARIYNPSFGFRLYTGLGTLVTESYHLLYGKPIPKIEPGDGYLEVDIDTLNLLPGRYYMSLWITDHTGQIVYDGDLRSVLQVEPANVYHSGHLPDSRQGIVYFPQRWKIPSQPAIASALP